MNIIGLKELRQNVTKYARKVQKGESFVVVKRSKPLFKIAPVDEEDQWETVIDFTKLTKDGQGIDADELLERLRKLR